MAEIFRKDGQKRGRRHGVKPAAAPELLACGVRGIFAVEQQGKMSGKWTPTVYFVIGQIGWFACVLSAARGVPWIGVSVVALLIAAHLWRAARLLPELKLVVGVAAIGAVWESAAVFFRVLGYPGGVDIRGMAPLWIVALWALFAAQFNTTYRWLKPRIGLASLLGAVAGPLSFRAGAALNAVRFLQPRVSVAVVAVGWAMLLPIVVVVSRRWDGIAVRHDPT
jgi:hypothetical protein